MVRNTYEVQNVGDLLREKRKQLGYDIKSVSEHTKIRSEYLLALETGNYEKFASDVYAKGFLKKYAKYLGINPDRASAMYRREKSPKQEDAIHTTDYLKRKIYNPAIELSLGRLVSIIIFIGLITLVGYLFSRVSVVLENPDLTISAPISAESGAKTTYTTTQSTVTFRGRVEVGSELKLNGVIVTVSNLQQFEIADQPLSLGDNRFEFVAKSQFGQESKLDITVVRQASSTNSTTPTNPNNPGGNTTPDTSTTQLLKANISSSNDNFISIESDGQQVFSDILSSGQIRNFGANREIIVTAQNPALVTISINGTALKLNTTGETKFILENGEPKISQ